VPKIVHWADELRFLLHTGGGERKPSQSPGLHVPVQAGRRALRHSLSLPLPVAGGAWLMPTLRGWSLTFSVAGGPDAAASAFPLACNMQPVYLSRHVAKRDARSPGPQRSAHLGMNTDS